MIPHHRNQSLENIIAEIDGIVYEERWLPMPINGYEKLFHISDFGRLKRLRRKSICKSYRLPDIKEKIILGIIDKKGYIRIRVRRNKKSRGFYMHRLVGLAFIPPVEGRVCINHKTGNKLKNHYTQLEWCTDAENNRHASLTGLFIGTNGFLTKEERSFIYDNFLTMGRTELAKKFNKSEDYIVNVFIDRGRNRKRISLKEVGAAKKAPIRHKEIINIQTGQTYISEQLAKELNTSRKEILRMISEERKPNTSPYRYTGRYIKAN